MEFLIKEGKLAAHEIARFLHIAQIEDRLRALHGEVPAPFARKIRATPKKRKRAISTKGRASYRLQGKYIAHIRRFPKAARSRYQKIARENGREKAIAAMKKDLVK